MKRVRVLLDKKTQRLLEALARSHAGNKSLVVRQAIRCYADREDAERRFGAVLARRSTRDAMESGIAAFNAGRLVPHKHLVRGVGSGS